ncbi:uncharacterized protein [Battus philenor]
MANSRRFCCDDETGEVLPYHINKETGEQLLNSPRPVHVASHSGKIRSLPKLPSINRSRRLQALKANITGSNGTSQRLLLLIPTFMIFPCFISVLLVVFEVFLHIRCHNKNRTLKDDNMYYRSPFHAVTKTFCGVCKDNAMVTKIGLLQDKRRYQYDYLRRIAI